MKHPVPLCLFFAFVEMKMLKRYRRMTSRTSCKLRAGIECEDIDQMRANQSLSSIIHRKKHRPGKVPLKLAPNDFILGDDSREPRKRGLHSNVSDFVCMMMLLIFQGGVVKSF